MNEAEWQEVRITRLRKLADKVGGPENPIPSVIQLTLRDAADALERLQKSDSDSKAKIAEWQAVVIEQEQRARKAEAALTEERAKHAETR